MPRAFYVIAHRGDSDHAPENTLAAFAAAVGKGADEIECDVRLSKDGVAVVLHDENLRRTAGVDARVQDLTFAEIRRLDAGGLRGEQFRGERVPTIEEVVAALLPQIPLEIELKAPGTVEPVLAVLRRHASQGAFERILMTSFDAGFLTSALKLESRVKTGWLLDPRQQVTPAQVRALGAVSAMPHVEQTTRQFVEEAHRLGLTVRAWGARNLDAVRQVIAADADGATYNDPAQLLAYLQQAGLRQHPLPLPPLGLVRRA